MCCPSTARPPPADAPGMNAGFTPVPSRFARAIAPFCVGELLIQ